MNIKEHIAVYGEFLDKYKSGQTSGEEVGLTIAHLAQCYSALSGWAVAKEQEYNTVFAEFSNSSDNDKPISMAKAAVLADASPEHLAHNEARKELYALEVEINALKSLQKGVLAEFSQAGL